MLETIREYAVERLEESGEADELRRRHAEYFTEIGPGGERGSRARAGGASGCAFAAIGTTFAPCSCGRSRAARSRRAWTSAAHSATVWLDRNVAVEGQRWFEALLERAEAVDEDVRAKALATASMTAGVRGDYALAEKWGEEALSYYRRIGSEEGIAWSLTTLAVGPIDLGQSEAAGPMLEEAAALHRKLGHEGGVRRILHLQGAACGGGRRHRTRPPAHARVRRALA